MTAAMQRRRRAVLGVLALVVLVAGGVAWFRRDRAAAAERRSGEQAMQQHDYPAACAHLRRYLDIRADDAEAHFLLARALRLGGNFGDAEQSLNEARRLGFDPRLVKREAALADLQQVGVCEFDTKDLESLVPGPYPEKLLLETLYRGDLLARNWNRAGYWLHLWLGHYEDDWAPRLWQADLLRKFKQYDRARADYLRVLELRPDQPQALLGLGLSAEANRADFDEAEHYLTRYLEVDPHHPEANVAWARCQFGRGNIAAARSKAVAILERHPQHAEAAQLLGSIEAEAGRDEAAVRWLLVAEPGDPFAVSYQLAQVLRRLGREQEAREHERRFNEVRELKRTTENASRAADREPKNPDRRYEVGRLLQKTGEEELAIQWFREALRLDAKHAPSHAALADYYARQSTPDAARRAEYHRERAGLTK